MAFMTYRDQRYAKLRNTPPSSGISIPGAVGEVTAIAFRAGGKCFAAAQGVNPLYVLPYMPTRPSLHGCIAIQLITARRSSPSRWKGTAAPVLFPVPRA